MLMKHFLFFRIYTLTVINKRLRIILYWASVDSAFGAVSEKKTYRFYDVLEDEARNSHASF